MLSAERRSGWARLSHVLVHVAVLAAGLAGLATFAVTMSEATPASHDMVSAVRDDRADAQGSPEPVADVEPTRTVRVVYPGR